MLRRIFASLLTALTLLSPVAATACGDIPVSQMNAIFSTPVTMKGRFVFVERISRRRLLHMVAEHQKISEPVIMLLRELI